MNSPYFPDRFNTSDGVESTDSESVESTDKDANNPVVNSDPFADKVPADPALIHETPMGGTLAAVAPLNEPVAEVIPMFETPNQEIPMGGTVAPVGPLNGPVDEVTPTYETPIHEAPMGETVAAVGPLNETLGHEAPIRQTIPYQAPVGVTIAEESQVSKSILYMAPISETITPEAPIVTNAVPSVALLNREESEHFRTRWNEIQGKFVDEPRAAVQQADALVSEVIVQITQMFAKEHGTLDRQWNQGNDVSTEDLRKALQHYRSFFNRLVV